MTTQPSSDPTNPGASVIPPHVVRTVLGDIDPADTGIALPHEHLLSDSSVWLQPARDATGVRLASQPITLDTLWWHRENPNTSRDVLVLDDVDLAVEELAHFSALGGATVVDLTPTGLGRNVLALVDISRRSGVHIVAGCGYYNAESHPPQIAAADIDEITQQIVQDIREGMDGTSVRAGIIGEIGTSHPLHPREGKVLRAAARAAVETGVAVSVHTAAHAITSRSALEAVEVLTGEGLATDRIVLGHMDTTLHRGAYHREVLATGAWLEFDLFGHEFFESENDFQSFGDTETARAVATLVDEGFASQLLLSQDICYKIQLMRYGGYGYAHLLRNIKRRLELWGVPQDVFFSMVVDNPRKVLTVPSLGVQAQ